jgi:hypothetical protein
VPFSVGQLSLALGTPSPSLSGGGAAVFVIVIVAVFETSWPSSALIWKLSAPAWVAV